MTVEEQQPQPEKESLDGAEMWNADAYRKAVKAYNLQTARALAANRNYSKTQGGERRYWSSVIFLRALLIGVSIRKLLPDIDAPKLLPWWDFASFANLVRALFELLLFFRLLQEMRRCSTQCVEQAAPYRLCRGVEIFVPFNSPTR